MTPYYDDGGITIYHGDCRDVLPRLSGDLVLTDPPYSHKNTSGKGIARTSAMYAPGGALASLLSFDLSLYADLLVGAAPMLVAFHSRDLVPDYAALARATRRSYDLHLWYKPNAPPFTGSSWKSDVEYIALVWSKRPGWARHPVAMYSKVWIGGNQSGSPEHPMGKPAGLMAKYIAVLDAQDVIDPFMGAGTTLVAAKQLGRRAIGVEREERYCEIAAKRLCQQTLSLGDAA